MAEAAKDSDPGALRAFARGTKFLLAVQLIIALAVVAITVWSGSKIQELAVQKAALQTDIGKLKTEHAGMAAQRDRVAKALPSVLNGVRAMRSDTSADWQQAVRFLQDAVAADNTDATSQRLLSRAQFKTGDATGALASLDRAQTLDNEATPPAALPVEDYALRAAYLCGSGAGAEALNLLRGAPEAFQVEAKARPTLVRENADLVGACPAEVVQQVRAAYGGAIAPQDVEAFAIRTVWLHISRDEDRAAAQRLQAALRGDGFRVNIERVDATGNYANIRYYYAPQAGAATQLAQRVKAHAEQLAIAPWSGSPLRTLSLEGRYENLPRHVIEVWLAPTG